jgi:NAD(P)H-flavin reductase
MEGSIIENTDIALGIKKFRIRLHEPFHFIPGQYVMISFPDDPENRKPFSVITYDAKANEITFWILKKGIFTSRLFSSQKWQKIIVSKAYGRFVLPEEKKDIVMIAGGIGITPFYSMIDYALKNKINIPISLFYSARTEEEMAYLEDLKNIRSKNIKRYYFFTREKSRIKNLFNSRIDIDILKNKLHELEKYRFYICGPGEMMKDLISQLTSQKVKEEDIITEEFK